MSRDLWLIFYVTYGVAALLLLAMLILWYATIYIAKDFVGRF